MQKIIVLGSGCSSCKKTFDLVSKKVKELGIKAEVVKNEDITELLKHGIISTPAIIIDKKIVFVGGIPTEKDIESWFKKLPEKCSCVSGC